jgi:dTDP-4-amino-4,6-dideoxygalactose transaminase
MVTTNDQTLFEELKVLRGHGSRVTYHYDIIGYNSRLDELQAAILRVKLRNIKEFLAARRQNAAHYNDRFKSLPPVQLPLESPGACHTYNQYTLRVERRDQLIDHLKAKGVPAMVYYPLSLHLQKAFSALGHKAGSFPASELAQNEVISLPIFPELSKEEADSVVSAVESFYR